MRLVLGHSGPPSAKPLVLLGPPLFLLEPPLLEQVTDKQFSQPRDPLSGQFSNQTV